MVRSLMPTPMSADQLDAVIALYHHVLPSMTLRFLRTFLTKPDVRTLVLLLPEDVDSIANDDDDSIEAVSDDDEEDGAEDDEADGEDGDEDEADGKDALAPAASDALTPEEAAARCEQRRLERRRLAGALSYEQGEHFGQHLVQVSLLGCRLRYQKLGVGSRLVGTLLKGEATAERPEAGIVWADTGAIPFFRRHGFNDDPILCSRYREIVAPWARSTLMSVQLAAARAGLLFGRARDLRRGGHVAERLGVGERCDSADEWVLSHHRIRPRGQLRRHATVHDRVGDPHRM
jgi:GNAT superfamily N-acetyltransferase